MLRVIGFHHLAGKLFFLSPAQSCYYSVNCAFFYLVQFSFSHLERPTPSLLVKPHCEFVYFYGCKKKKKQEKKKKKSVSTDKSDFFAFQSCCWWWWQLPCNKWVQINHLWLYQRPFYVCICMCLLKSVCDSACVCVFAYWCLCVCVPPQYVATPGIRWGCLFLSAALCVCTGNH